MLPGFGPHFHTTPALTLCIANGERGPGIHFPELPIPTTIYHLRLPTAHLSHYLRRLFIDDPDIDLYSAHRVAFLTSAISPSSIQVQVRLEKFYLM